MTRVPLGQWLNVQSSFRIGKNWGGSTRGCRSPVTAPYSAQPAKRTSHASAPNLPQRPRARAARSDALTSRQTHVRHTTHRCTHVCIHEHCHMWTMPAGRSCGMQQSHARAGVRGRLSGVMPLPSRSPLHAVCQSLTPGPLHPRRTVAPGAHPGTRRATGAVCLAAGGRVVRDTECATHTTRHVTQRTT